MALTYGIAALARPTFDVPFAEEKLHEALRALDEAGIATVGPRTLLFDAASAEQAIDDIAAHGGIDLLLILQMTFTDAAMTVKLAGRASAPVAIWAVPEPRAGGRLRLNAFCGLNLAAHALGLSDLAHNWLYADPEADDIARRLHALNRPPERKPSLAGPATGGDPHLAAPALEKLNGLSVGLVGQHPDGFHTCRYTPRDLAKLGTIAVHPVTLDTLFERAKSVTAERVSAVIRQTRQNLRGLEALDQEQLDRSLRVFCALEDLQKEDDLQCLAVRCWPETFTDYGCAACGPMAMMTERRVPSACEADMFGAVSTLIIQEIAREPAWMADLVDLDMRGDTGVFWHCGLAPLSMCDSAFEPEATIHTNRKMPLLHQFPLKPGVITIFRLSQARNTIKAVIGRAEVIRAPMAFTGTSGVVCFPKSGASVCETLMDEGLEHHYTIAYGDHRPALKALAAALELPVLEIC